MRARLALCALLAFSPGPGHPQTPELLDQALERLAAEATYATAPCLDGASACADDGPEALAAALCAAILPGVAQATCRDLDMPDDTDPDRLFAAVQDGLAAARAGTVPGPDALALGTALLRRALGEAVELPALAALPPVAPAAEPGASLPSDLPDPLPTEREALEELAFEIILRAAQEGWDAARREAALTPIRDLLNGGPPTDPAPADLIAAALARARGADSCDGVAFAEGDGPHLPFSEVHLDLPPGFLGPEGAMSAVYLTDALALPMLILPDAGGRATVTLPLHPEGIGGGPGLLSFGWVDAKSGATVLCPPLPLDIAAATAIPEAWPRALADLADAAALLERGADWAGLPMGGLPRTMQAELADLAEGYADLPAEARAVLDLYAPRIAPDREMIAAMEAWIDTHPAPIRRGALDTVPGGPERLWHAAGGGEGGGQSHICPADIGQLRTWILLGSIGNANADPLNQALFTAGSVLAGTSVHLFLAAAGQEKGGEYAERGVGVAAGSYNLFLNFMQGVAPYRITAIEGHFARDRVTEDTSDPALRLVDVALRTDSRGWSPLRGAVDLAMIVAAASGRGTTPGGALGKQVEQMGFTGATGMAAREGLTLGRVLVEEGAKAISATLGNVIDAAILDALWREAIGEIEKQSDGLVQPRCRIPDPLLTTIDAYLIDRDWRAARPAFGHGVFLAIDQGFVGVEMSVKPDIGLPRDRVADPVEAWTVIQPAALSTGDSDLVVEPGEQARVEVTGAGLENRPFVDWEVVGEAAIAWDDDRQARPEASAVRVQTPSDPEGFPIAVTATLTSLTLERSREDPPTLTQIVTTGEADATVRPACGWVGARVEIGLNDRRTGRALDPHDFAWMPGPGLTALAPGVFGITEAGPPSLVRFQRPGDSSTVSGAVVRRDCACGPDAFPGLVTELQPFSRAMLALTGQQSFAVVGTGTVEITGDITRFESYPEMRLTVLTEQDANDLSCRYTSVLTNSEMGTVEALRQQRADLFLDDSGSNLFDGTGGFDFAGPGLVAPGGGGAFGAPIPYRGSELQGGFRPQLPPVVAVEAFAPDALEIVAQTRGCDETDVDRGFPARRTNFYDTIRTCATHEARFVATQRP
ncbi:hypothetical protein [Wenxinia saemankumensis]|uniref:Uncharacterized protein n=1 Tax=Wenxinia saemankumensis TaxID=1447782 RepID=A0A1M5ZXY6_9RHOB|nr:hypothetical protein [Wenxinia saemankumensis]SHI29100.1 hypothetical protein SAMN05444417_0049 [Wenxinia saemankumensis]